jgi:NAD(P)-dependent dehydrogenase (short-subunit alcohol dehydrogenase family)
MILPWKHAIVLGASSGMGKALAEELLAGGANVAMLARRTDAMEAIAKSAPDRAKVYAHDVRNYEEIPALFQQITKDLGGLDLVIYASGSMPSVDEHEYDFTKDREMLETNLLGGVAWLDEAAKRFEQTKMGTIIGISSVAGDRGRRGSPAYCTSKAALATFLESLRNRLSRYGVKVVTIKPGFIDTEMTRGKPGLFWLISAKEAAHRILTAARSGVNTAYVPGRWRAVMFIIRMIPSFVFRHLPI